MSCEPNEALFERAAEMIDHFENKLPAQLIEADMERRDWDALYYHVCAVEALAAQEEFEHSDVY